MQISIREAADADLPAIAAILNDEIASSPYVYAETLVTLEERRVWLASHIGEGLPVVVATSSQDAGQVLGWAALSPYRPSTGYRFTTEASVYVASVAQRRGIGGQLLSFLCDEAARRQQHALVASIDSENAPSITLFERHGFAEVGRLAEVGRKFERWRTQLLFLKPMLVSRAL
jgi:L-amino acid N-acyltransferase